MKASPGTWREVASRDELRALVPHPNTRNANKVRRRLDAMDRAFLDASSFWLVATSSEDGRCDVSPKGDPAGSVLVLDEQTLALPDRPGNRRMDGYLDLLENPHVGLLFLIPGRGDTLRVNGRAKLVSDAPFFDNMVVEGHRPRLVLVVEVEEVFYHCSKAFLRSRMWQPGDWDPDRAPSRAEIAKALERPEESLEDLERYYGPSYGENLYCD
ncbi:MSMEG_1061 family FMN-dependent PPOX-type flavoprotein [Janibacter anophelis]|uniref:MSMEG_1061 family FMN-dependent PPOX-type flavoprotein n=1 Tax=Janibacter anophelis TaxID=319054 RepID=UPI000835CF01|nr:MSMEG_1061 family FMN-dependent PPOX-type flavoprotein [Janibacter anophelis]